MQWGQKEWLHELAMRVMTRCPSWPGNQEFSHAEWTSWGSQDQQGAQYKGQLGWGMSPEGRKSLSWMSPWLDSTSELWAFKDTWYKVVHVGMPARMVPGHPWPTNKCFGLILSIRYWVPSYADSYLGLVLAPSRLGGVLWTKVAFILEVANRASVSR